MTWGSFFSRSLSLVVVRPLLLTRLSTEEIALWYLFMTIISFQMLVVFGTLALAKPISLVQNTFSAWSAWGMILVVSTVTIRGNIYSAYLQGINQIALLRRWEAITSLGAIITSFLVLILGGKLLGLVIAHQGWQLLNILRNRWLSGVVEDG